MIFKHIITFLTLVFTVNLAAQTSEHDDHDLNYHGHHKNELGIAIAPVYFLKEKIIAFGLHIHYIRSIPNSKFGLGLGYERLFDEHKHNTIGLISTYKLIDKFNFSISPGLTFEDNNSNANFALHFELSYEFEIKNLHIGPAFEFAYDQEDFHLSLGVHLGFGF